MRVRSITSPSRPDIDSNKLAYLGVSMGSAEGVIISTLLQDRVKTAIFLDGGYFLFPLPAGSDQADFAPRMKKPVLMVNGVTISPSRWRSRRIRFWRCWARPIKTSGTRFSTRPTMLPNSARSW